MRHKNILVLEGRVGNDFRYSRTIEGRVYASFTLQVKSFDKELKDSTENKEHIRIRIEVFDHKLVKYLQAVNCHNGCLVNILGRLNAYKAEKNGVTFYQNDVVVRDINVIKTLAD